MGEVDAGERQGALGRVARALDPLKGLAGLFERLDGLGVAAARLEPFASHQVGRGEQVRVSDLGGHGGRVVAQLATAVEIAQEQMEPGEVERAVGDLLRAAGAGEGRQRP